jgi:beta-lactam-binding protein with PASTA domain
VIDSVFVSSFPRGTVFEQNPKAGAHVKKNRKIFLTMNLMAPKKIPMPNVVNYSLRQAKAELISKGFRVGRLIYRYDIATNIVLSQEYQDRTIEEGMLLPMGTKVDLMLGLNSPSETTSVPNTVGLPYSVACDLITESSLNVGVLHFDEKPRNITDTLNSKVYKQEPAYYTSNYVALGSKINLYLKSDKKDN